MSGKVVGWAFEQRCRTPVAKLILVKLADNANEDGYCWPSVALIVRHTGLSERAVRENLRHLEADGLIRVDSRIGSKGQSSNGYQLAVGGCRQSTPPAPDAGGVGHQVQGVGALGAGSPCMGSTPNRRTVNEPTLNLPDRMAADSDARGLTARVAKFSRAIGEDIFNGWFSEACFEEGPPVTIRLPKQFQVNWVRNHFLSTLVHVFGDDVRVVGAEPPKSHAATAATAATEDLCTPKTEGAATGMNSPWWNREESGAPEAA